MEGGKRADVARARALLQSSSDVFSTEFVLPPWMGVTLHQSVDGDRAENALTFKSPN